MPQHSTFATNYKVFLSLKIGIKFPDVINLITYKNENMTINAKLVLVGKYTSMMVSLTHRKRAIKNKNSQTVYLNSLAAFSHANSLMQLCIIVIFSVRNNMQRWPIGYMA